jgi:hypothetical protein
MNRILQTLLFFLLFTVLSMPLSAQKVLTQEEASYYKGMLANGHTRAYVDSAMKADGKYYKGISTPNTVLATGAEQDCQSGIPVCQNFYTQATSYTGYGSYQEVHNACLMMGEQCSVWYIFTIQTPPAVGSTATLNFTLTTVHDYDWAIYDLTQIGGCSKVPTSTPVSCNYSARYGNTGISTALAAANSSGGYPAGCGSGNGAATAFGPNSNYTANPFNCDLSVTVGHTYAMIVDNFTQDHNGYTLDFSGGNAILFNNAPPTIANVTYDCVGTVTMTMSELVTCASIDQASSASGNSDFTVSGPGAMAITSATGVGCTGAEGSVPGQTTNQILFSLTSPPTSGTYTLTSKAGGDGNTVLNYCTNASLAVGATATFNYLAPITLSTSAASLCAGGAGATITSNGGNPDPSLGWTDVWTPTPLTGQGTHQITVNPAATTSYQETVTWGTCTQTHTQTETVIQTPVVNVTPMNPVVCSVPIPLTATSTQSGVSCPSCTYTWTGSWTGTGSTTSQGVGTYTVSAISATGGCTSTPAVTTVATTPAATGCNIMYVSTGGGGNGLTPATPTDIVSALASSACNGAYIKMQVGIYTISAPLVVGNNITIEGGFNAGGSPFTTKTSNMAGGASSTTIQRTAVVDAATKNVTAFSYAAGASGFRLQDLRIEMPGGGTNPATNAAGSQTTNYAIFMGTGCSGYNIVRCYIDAGVGGSGTTGTSGVAVGAKGSDGAVNLTTCYNAGAGGAGGGNGGAGGNGGTGSHLSPNGQTAGSPGLGTAGGTAGAQSVFNDGSSWGQLWNMDARYNGGAGGNGNALTGGVAPAGPAGAVGTASYAAGYYVPGNGGAGTIGTGGSGGGGGGGAAGNSNTPDYGMAGAGGGGGGGGGAAGLGGTGGGGSFGVYSVAMISGNVTDCYIVSAGGAGGAGGSGAAGGAGGKGMTSPLWICGSGTGGSNGASGNGGTGGSGGAGGTGAAGDVCLVCNITGGTLKNTVAYTSVTLATQPVIFAGDATNSNTNCQNVNMNMTTGVGGLPWASTGATPNTGSGLIYTLNYAAAGRYNVTMNANAYTGFNNIITTAPSPGSIVSSNGEICSPGSATFTSTLGGAPGFSYAWSVSPAAGVVIASPAAFTTSVSFPSVAVQTTYTMTLVVRSSCCGTIGTLTSTILIDPLPADPTLTAAPSTICPGSSSVLSVTVIAGLSYNWYDAATGGTLLGSGPSLTVSPAVTTTYYVDATSAGGCVSITPRAGATVTVTATPAPTCPGITICGTQTITLSVTSPISGAIYDWNSSNCSGTMQSSNDFTYTSSFSATSTIYVSVIAPGGCNASACTPVTVTVNAAPTSFTWTGGGSAGIGNWFDPANWGSCAIPNCGTDVTIPNTAGAPITNPPNIGFNTTFNNTDLPAACQSITIANGNQLIFGDTKAELDVCKHFNHNGSVVMTSKGRIVFMGTVAQNYTHTSTGTGDFYDVVLNNSTGLTVVDGAGNLDLNTAAPIGAIRGGTFSFATGILTTQNTRTLCIKDTACTAISGYSLTSYVYGNLRRYLQGRSGQNFFPATTYSYDFPVGNATSYQLMNLRFRNTNLSYVTTFFNNPPTAALANGTGLPLADGSGNYTVLLDNGGPANNVGSAGQIGGVWTVMPSATSGYIADYEVMLYGRNFDNYAGANGTNPSSLKRNTFCPGIWACDVPSGAGHFVSGALDGNNNVVTDRDSMNLFSQFAIALHSTILPIELSAFDAICVNNKVSVTWTSATETNNAFYTVERSCENSGAYEKVGTVPGAGNSSTGHQYSLEDSTFPGGTCYYRLKQTDFNGMSVTFNPVSLNCKEEIHFGLFSIFPNPTADALNIIYTADQEGPVQLTLVNMLGQTLQATELHPQIGLNTTKLDLSTYSNAVYFIRISNGTKTIIRRVSKDR